MQLVNQTYTLDIKDNLHIYLDINKHGNVVVTKAIGYYGDEDDDSYEFYRDIYCKPNIRFTVIPQLDLEEQIWYHLNQRDRIGKIERLMESTKVKLEKMIELRINKGDSHGNKY